jgi:succinate dehydrogenase/fumarate reductase cytochrome b subunit (b558 family)
MAELTRLEAATIFAGDYRIIQPLAEGGMGALYLADQLSTGNRRVLKLMQPQLVTDQRLRERFALEARVGSQIESDHIVQVLGAGVDPTLGVPWLAMELLRGDDLATTIAKRGRLAPLEVREIFGQLCHALAAAHDRGIVHRDIKPENVFLTVPRLEGATFMVKVLDFGIAKLVAEAQTKQTSAIGSPLWMAPEQTDAGRGVSVATDIWPLGLIAFQALTGKYFWRGVTESVIALIREIVFEPIVPATARAAELGVRELLPARGFDEWFARCVAQDPKQRFASVREARAALDALLTHPVPSAAGDLQPSGVPDHGALLISRMPATTPMVPRTQLAPPDPYESTALLETAIPLALVQQEAQESPATVIASANAKSTTLAVSGVILFGFVILHLLGNLQVLRGPEVYNGYTTRFTENPVLLWTARAVLLAAALVHTTLMLQLYGASTVARPRGDLVSVSMNYWALTVRYTGPLLLCYTIFHVAHFTFPGFALGDYEHVPGDTYSNFVNAFHIPWVVALYVIANVIFGFHLYHSAFSTLQSVGFNQPRYNRSLGNVVRGLALLVTAGNMFLLFTVPLGLAK